jgi:hypothetical protein
MSRFPLPADFCGGLTLSVLFDCNPVRGGWGISDKGNL